MELTRGLVRHREVKVLSLAIAQGDPFHRREPLEFQCALPFLAIEALGMSAVPDVVPVQLVTIDAMPKCPCCRFGSLFRVNSQKRGRLFWNSHVLPSNTPSFFRMESKQRRPGAICQFEIF